VSVTRNILLIDLTAGTTTVETVEVEASFGLGGKTLGAQLLERYLEPSVDPLSPGNVVVMTPSPLAAYGVPGSNRFGAFTRSPLTRIWLECYCGGTFGRAFTETGWDAAVIRGAAKAPVRVHLSQAGAEISPAEGLWGREPADVEEELLASLDKRSAVLAIGVAGENRVRVASVMHEEAHALGRGGMGAVFGSKKLKAVTVTSPGAARMEVSEKFATARRELARAGAESPLVQGYRRFGTPAVAALTNEYGAFPTDFFIKGTAPHRDTLEADRWREWADYSSEGCPPCPIRCRHTLTLKDGPHAGRRIHAAEYETIYSFGGSAMVRHARDVAFLNELCNRYGLDSISAGNLAAAAIKAHEMGRLPEGPAAGDTAAIGELLSHIAHRSTPTGDTLAEGMDHALETWGMSDWSISSKGMDPAGYEPRRLKGMALSNALSVRGACHLRATFYKPELSGLLEGLDDEQFVTTYVDWEDRMTIMDSLTMCRFYRDLLPWEQMLPLVAHLNGGPVTRDDLKRLSQRTISRIRRLNFALGCTPDDDTVAERFFREATDRAPALDREELKKRVALYWRERGWTEEGRLPEGMLPPVDSPLTL
jgi:aldehyde:ferredoxin oxidoreductase